MNACARRVCLRCCNEFSETMRFCPVCMLREALAGGVQSRKSSASEARIKTTRREHAAQRFEHYELVKGKDGKPLELGRGAMGVTYKAFDVDLHCPVTLKVIHERYLGDESARLRFLREARMAARLRHSNVASVLHLGRTGNSYFYAMEFVEGETLENLIKRSGRLEPKLALEIVAQVEAGLTAIQKQHLVHRDIKPSNIMVSLKEGKLESVKIIDLGLAKGVAEEDAISSLGSFIGTPEFASPEQFAGIGADIRSDLYSLGVTLWEMLAGKLPFQGSRVDLMDQHQHARPPSEQLKGIPAPIAALLEIVLAKDPNDRFQSPPQLQKALARVKEAIISKSRLSAKDLRSDDPAAVKGPKKYAFRWILASSICAAALVFGGLFFFGYRGSLSNQRDAGATPIEKALRYFPSKTSAQTKMTPTLPMASKTRF